MVLDVRFVSGYWQVGVHPEDKEKIVFTISYGLYLFTDTENLTGYTPILEAHHAE